MRTETEAVDLYVTWQTVITAAAVIAAVAIAKYFTKAHNWVLRQEEQDKAISDIKGEQQVLVYGVLACLKGLKERGCNGPVTDAINKIEKHLNKEAHKWDE